MSLYAGKAAPDLLDYLLKRRSVKAADMTPPGPSPAQLDVILEAAARVPDHGKLCPWYFITLEGKAREQAGEILRRTYAAENPEDRADKIEAEAQRFTRAPVVVAVVSRARQGKPPLWEQVLSVGAACQNLVLAANASGFAAQWVTEWYSYNDAVKKEFGLDERDHFAGFIYLGTPAKPAEERDRPDMSQIVTRWSPGAALNKGDIYNREKFDIPLSGFDFSDLKT